MPGVRAFLHCHHRFKNGKDHCYWSIAEKVKVAGERWAQRHILYLGDINSSQRAAWTKVIEVFDTTTQRTTELALYPAEQSIPAHAIDYGVQVRLGEFRLHRPRQWGACWVGCRMSQLTRLVDSRLFEASKGLPEVIRKISQNFSPAGVTSPFMARAIPTDNISIVPVSGR